MKNLLIFTALLCASANLSHAEVHGMVINHVEKEAVDDSVAGKITAMVDDLLEGFVGTVLDEISAMLGSDEVKNDITGQVRGVFESSLKDAFSDQ